MTRLPRLRPDPIPAIHPLPEYRVEGERKARYEDMKAVLQVPWMGVITMAYAHYPSFFSVLWQGLRELCGSTAYVDAARSLRGHIEAAAATLGPTPLAPRLTEMGYAPRELDQIRALIEVFSHGNHLYFPIALLSRLLLEGEGWKGGGAAEPFPGRHAPEVTVPFLLMEAHHVDAPTRALYEEIKATLELPFVNTDYRALARWPSYFALAWNDLKPKLESDAYEGLCQAFHDRATEVVSALPNPAGLGADALRQAAERDASLAELVACCRLFTYLLPGLTLNVAYFAHQLARP